MSGLQLTSAQRLPALLMAVTVVWALIFAVAGLAGLGGRYRLHPDDPSRVPALPALDLSQAHSPLQQVDAYAEIGERPLFNPDRKPLPVEDAAGGGEATDAPADVAPLDVVLTSVILTPELRIAIITDNRSGSTQTVKVGGALEGDQSGWRLQELEPRKAVFVGGTGTATIDLRVFDGAGGQAPTAPVQVAQPVAEASQNTALVQPGATDVAADQPAEAAAKPEPLTPEARAEMIRRRIEERRRQMREEAERNNRQ